MSVRRPSSEPETDRIYYRSTEPHTSIPDWVPFCRAISPEARNLIAATLVLQRQQDMPTRGDLAHALGVDERTIYRWLGEIQAAGAMTIHRIGRRRDITFHRPIPDRMISDHAISDPWISDRPIRYTRDRVAGDSAPARHGSAIPDRAISDPHGGGGDHDSNRDSPPTTTRRTKVLPGEITTDTGRWMVAEGFSLKAARELQHMPLAPAQADYQRRRLNGAKHGAIVEAWRVEPPTGASAVLPAPAIAGEFTHSAAERARYEAMGFKFAGDSTEGVEQ